MTLKQVESEASPGTLILKIKNTDIHFSSTLDLKDALNNKLITQQEYNKLYFDFFRPFKLNGSAIILDPNIKYFHIEVVKVA